MPVQTDGVYEVKMKMRGFGEEMLNIFHYVHDNGQAGLAVELADKFGSFKVGGLANLIGTAYEIYEIECEELGSLDNIATQPITFGNGSLTGENLPPHVTWTAKLNRQTRDTRNGSKRFSGLTKEAVSGTGLTANVLTAFQDEMDDLVDAIPATVGQFDLAIVRKPAGQTEGPWTFSYVGSITAQNRVTSQNSRKVYG